MKTFPFVLGVMLAGFSVTMGLRPAHAQSAQVITLTQTPCQFLEVEQDHGYTSTQKSDCDAINARTASERLKQARVLTIKPGAYIFRVRNKNVPYELGFWLRDKDYNWRNPLHKITKTSVSGGGLTQGQTQDYAVTLKPGTYLYSCPLNTTPDYTLIVTEP